MISTDPKAGTATFSLRAVPKTYVEGMTAIFQARSGETVTELPLEPGADHAFSGRLSCPITDKIDLTVVFLTGDKRETQWLNDFYGLYTESFPELMVDGSGRLWFDIVHLEDNLLPPSEMPGVQIQNYGADSGWGWSPEPPATIQVGLFRDQKLVMWYEEQMVDTILNGVPTVIPAWFRTREIELEPGVYCEAAVYTDEYGRQRVYPDSPEIYPYEKGTSASAAAYAGSSDPAGWEF